MIGHTRSDPTTVDMTIKNINKESPHTLLVNIPPLTNAVNPPAPVKNTPAHQFHKVPPPPRAPHQSAVEAETTESIIVDMTNRIVG